MLWRRQFQLKTARRYLNTVAKTTGDYNTDSSNADATATVLSDRIDFQKSSKSKDSERLTWWEILEKKAQRIKEGKQFESLTIEDVKTTDIIEKTRGDSFTFLKLPFKSKTVCCQKDAHDILFPQVISSYWHYYLVPDNAALMGPPKLIGACQI